MTERPGQYTEERVDDEPDADFFALIEAKSYAEAMTLANRFMELHRLHWPTFEGECEVRPLEPRAQ